MFSEVGDLRSGPGLHTCASVHSALNFDPFRSSGAGIYMHSQ